MEELLSGSRHKAALKHSAHAALHRLRNLAGQLNTQLKAPVRFELKERPRVLVMGIYLANKPNLVSHLVRAYEATERCIVEQKWISMNGIHTDPKVQSVTALTVEGFVPKFVLLNRLFKTIDVRAYDYIVLTDDDVRVRKRFLDSLISCQEHFDFAIAQPARTWNSYHDHRIVLRDPRYVARQTWFVEIGPVVSLQRRVLGHVLPFDEQSPMGYGYDFVWPCLLRDAGLTMGIIDCCPLDHSQRERAQHYSVQAELDVMYEYLRDRPHVTRAQARQNVRRY
ncbi:MAG: hypothetical protein RL701_7345, partial [Pseudomonadota bacterium]